MRTFAFIALVSAMVACTAPVKGDDTSKPLVIDNKAALVNNSPEETKPDVPAGPKYAVSDLGSKSEDGVRWITGTVTNNSGRRANYIQVSINLLDGSGNVIGSTMTNVNNVEAGQKWKFKALLTEDHAKSFVVKEVDGW